MQQVARRLTPPPLHVTRVLQRESLPRRDEGRFAERIATARRGDASPRAQGVDIRCRIDD